MRRDGYVKLLDFGLARLLEPDGAFKFTTQSLSESSAGVLGATPGYMSPEQARDQTITESTDIFALGLVLYELTTGQHPFPSSSPIGVLTAILTEAPLPPSRLQPEIPTPLEDLILQMLEKDPTDRPAAFGGH